MNTSAPPTMRWDRQHTGVFVVLCAVAVVMAVFLCRFTIDDAFITWRYGQTLVHHGMWTWDPWAPRVEAYTNPIYAFVSIIPALLGMSPELFFKGFSLLLAVAFTAWVVRQGPVSPWQRLVIVALTIANPVFQFHLWSGLETPLYIATLAMSFGSLAMRGRLGSVGLAAVVVLALTRPEGIAFAGLAVGWQWLIRRDRRSLLVGIGVVAGIVVYWTVRALWFGRFFPNTFYVKSTGGSTTEKLVTLAYNLGVTALVLAALVALAITLRPASADLGTRPSVRELWATAPDVVARWTPLVFALGAAAVAVVLNRASNLLMNYANRFEFQLVVPVLVVMLLTPLGPAPRRAVVVAPVAVAGAVTVASMATVASRPVQGLVLLAMAGLGAALIWSTRRAAAVAFVAITLTLSCALYPIGGMFNLVDYRPRLENSHHALAQILRDSPVTNRTLVVGDAGIIPLASGWHSIDQYGLANTWVTDQTFTQAQLASADPSVIIINGNLTKQSTSSGIPGTNTSLQFALAPENGFTYLGGIVYGSYSLQVYVNEDIDDTTRRQIEELATRSHSENGMPDTEFFAKNRFNTPFLGGR